MDHKTYQVLNKFLLFNIKQNIIFNFIKAELMLFV